MSFRPFTVSNVPGLVIRSATPLDIEIVYMLTHELFDYEKILDDAVGTIEQLYDVMYGPNAYIEVALAVYQGEVVGSALFCENFSTYQGKPGLHLEDLFVRKTHRGLRAGKALLAFLATLSIERGYSRLEWSCLLWNTPSIEFYKALGASELKESLFRCEGEKVQELAARFDTQYLDQGKNGIVLRHAEMKDVDEIVAMIGDLATFENEPSLLSLISSENLIEKLFGKHSDLEVIIGSYEGQVSGFALFYRNICTCNMKPGLFIEDLYVKQTARSKGMGKAMLHYLGHLTIKRDWCRVEAEINPANIVAKILFESTGISELTDWTHFRVEGSSLQSMSQAVSLTDK